jgi:hypothetical protein
LGSICFRYDDECGERSIDIFTSACEVRGSCFLFRQMGQFCWNGFRNMVSEVESGAGEYRSRHDRRLGQKILEYANQTKETDLQPVITSFKMLRSALQSAQYW